MWMVFAVLLVPHPPMGYPIVEHQVNLIIRKKILKPQLTQLLDQKAQFVQNPSPSCSPWSIPTLLPGCCSSGTEQFGFHMAHRQRRSIHCATPRQSHSPGGIRQTASGGNSHRPLWRRMCTGFWRQGIAGIFWIKIGKYQLASQFSGIFSLFWP